MDTRKIRAIVKRPGLVPKSVWVSNSPASLAKEVEGNLCPALLPQRVVMLVPAGQKAQVLNIVLDDREVRGTALFVGAPLTPGGLFEDLPLTFQAFKRAYAWMWRTMEE